MVFRVKKGKRDYFGLAFLIAAILIFVFSIVEVSASLPKRVDWARFLEPSSSDVALAPAQPASVNAYQCNADEICEIQEAKVNGGVFGGYLSIGGQSGVVKLYADGDKVDVSGPLWIRSSLDFFNLATSSGGIPLSRIALDGLQGNALNILSYAGRNIKLTTEKDGKVIVSSLAGKGNGYVCVDNDGALYHSTKACV